jgi:hypothetical protein
MSDTVKRQHAVEQLERQRDHDFTLLGYQSDRVTPAALVSGDVVRFKVWDSGDVDTAPTLDLDSVALASGTFTADAGTDELTAAAHGLSNGQRVRLTSGGTLPAGLLATVAYYVVNKTTNTFQVSLTSGGAAVNFSDAGTGTHSFARRYSGVVIAQLGVDGSEPFEATVELLREEVNQLTAGTWNWEASVVKASDPLRCFPFALGTFDVVDNAAGDLSTS